MISRDVRDAIGRAVVAAGYDLGSLAIPDPGLRPGGSPGQYSSSVAFEIAGRTKQSPMRIARILADTLQERVPERGWVERAEVTGPGYITVTVTRQALIDVAERITEAGPGCVRSHALSGHEEPAPTAPAGAWEDAGTWEEARDLLHAEITATLAEAAGATISHAPARSSYAPNQSSYAPDRGNRGTGEGTGGEKASVRSEEKSTPEEKNTEVGAALAFAGTDAVRFCLARAQPEQSLAVDPEIIARHVLGNPAYAVRYAHARAASGVRWALALGTPQTGPQRRPADQGELKLLDVLSWLPERVATAARRHRPDEFARYLERVAGVTLDTLTSPAGGRAPGNDRLAVARAARTGLAAGLTLLGVGAPDRL